MLLRLLSHYYTPSQKSCFTFEKRDHTHSSPRLMSSCGRLCCCGAWPSKFIFLEIFVYSKKVDHGCPREREKPLHSYIDVCACMSDGLHTTFQQSHPLYI
jgi:hypothetical protein